MGILLCVGLWIVYNVPILAVGVRSYRRTQLRPLVKRSLSDSDLPFVSIVVPVKNEEKVVGRLFSSISRLDYPASKRELIIVEDGSTNRTFEICKAYAVANQGVLVLRRLGSDGKPSALNFGLKYARGDVVAFFDADSVPAVDTLRQAAEYFHDARVAAVQGRTFSINAEENMLTRFVAFEEAVWCEAYLRGKDALGLFVHLRGNCMFVRRSVLSALGGFEEGALSEDMDLSARLLDHGYAVRYASDVRVWQESPAGLRQLVAQRTRWFRGTMKVAVRYGRLMAGLDWRRLDAEAEDKGADTRLTFNRLASIRVANTRLSR